jgi:hypothetical protein
MHHSPNRRSECERYRPAFAIAMQKPINILITLLAIDDGGYG